MTIDRAELAGTGAAIAFHAALIVAMSLSLAHVVHPPETPSMEVELVDEVGLQAAAPAALAAPPPSRAPEQEQDIAPQQRQIAPAPQITPTPPPPAPNSIAAQAAELKPAPNSIAAQAAELKPAPKRPRPPVKTLRARPAAAAPSRPRVSQIGADFLKGIADAPPAVATAKPAAATFDGVAKSSVAASIKRQIQPCADQQPFIGDGANRIQLGLNLRLDRSGRLLGPPTLVGSPSGVDDDNSRYVAVVKDQARRVFAACAPLRLPAELYQTPNGGWGNITIRYKVK